MSFVVTALGINLNYLGNIEFAPIGADAVRTRFSADRVHDPRWAAERVAFGWSINILRQHEDFGGHSVAVKC